MASKFKPNVQLFAGEVEQPQQDVEQTNVDKEIGNLDEETAQTNEQTNVVNEQNTPETQENQDVEEDKFDPEKLDFEQEDEIELDATPYESLKEKGIDINGKNFKQNVSLLQECGMTDPEQISKFIEKLQEKQLEASKPKSAKEINKILRDNLSDDAKKNYKGISNMLYNIFKDNPEAKEIINRTILTDPLMIEVINDIRKYYTGGKKVDTENPPVQTKAKSTMTAEQAMSEYNKLMAEEMKKNKYVSPAREKEIIKSIEAKLSPTVLAGFKEYF